MNTLSRSWKLTKTTLGVLRMDPEMLVFPLLAGVTNLVFLALFLVPTVFVELLPALAGEGQIAVNLTFGFLEMVVFFALYVALAFTSTFFNVCVAYTARTRFEGGNAGPIEALSFAASRAHRIFAWSLLAATVGVFLRQLDNLADKGGIPGLIFGAIRGLIGFAWALVQLFVVPVMVYEDVGPIEALTRSATTLRETWGESLVRHVGFGALQGLLFIPIVCLFVGALVGFIELGPAVGLGLLVVAVLAVFLMASVMSVLNTVFNTALFHYAHTGHVPQGFEAVGLDTALRSR